jgi:hypothetical protein
MLNEKFSILAITYTLEEVHNTNANLLPWSLIGSATRATHN